MALDQKWVLKEEESYWLEEDQKEEKNLPFDEK